MLLLYRKPCFCVIITAMRLARRLADRIDRLNTQIGRAAAWLVLVVVLLQFALVVARYLFGLGSLWLSETVIYAHATLFLLAGAWTLSVGARVRGDIFYADASLRAKAVIDLIGAVLLPGLPCARRRRHGEPRTHRFAGRQRRRHDCGDAGDVPARLRHGRLRGRRSGRGRAVGGGKPT